MKKVQTNSPTTFIMENFDKKFIRQYKKKINGLYAYPRIIPIDKTLKLLEGSGVKHPKLLKSRFRCVDIEYIKGETLMVEPNLTGLITLVNDYIYELSLINCEPIMKYVTWNSPKEFLNFLVDNMVKVVDSYENNEKLDSIGLTKDLLLKFKDKDIDNSRKLILIHGDITPDNIISSSDGYYLIDWELANYGDVAYELASHFLAVEYTSSAKEELIEKVAISLNENKGTLFADVDTYIEFENTRRCFSIMNRVIENIKVGKTFDSILEDGFKYYSLFFEKATKEDLIDKLK